MPEKIDLGPKSDRDILIAIGTTLNQMVDDYASICGRLTQAEKDEIELKTMMKDLDNKHEFCKKDMLAIIEERIPKTVKDALPAILKRDPNAFDIILKYTIPVATAVEAGAVSAIVALANAPKP